MIASQYAREGAAGPSTRQVAIVVPLSDREGFTPDEEQSLAHLDHFLGRYDKYFAAPEGLTIERGGFAVRPFPRKFFGSSAAHNQLLMWPQFYQTFEAYEYILIYHLDSLVFCDELARWCRTGWDYIGAPWVPCEATPWVKQAVVGNGGFTLMKVESVLRVLAARRQQRPLAYWSDLLVRNGRRLRPMFAALARIEHLFAPSSIVGRAMQKWRVSQDPALYGSNNDYFWSFEAPRVSSFKVATVQDGLRFAFEAAPRDCFERNGRRLPFGCHAWAKFDRAFWEPYLLPPNTAAGRVRRHA
jgi:hypothetical protein